MSAPTRPPPFAAADGVRRADDERVGGGYKKDSRRSFSPIPSFTPTLTNPFADPGGPFYAFVLLSCYRFLATGSPILTLSFS
ncbi:hypothetical protein QCA50_010531 [Cerrena zonata]|uniref:Uncharacterized protein n=1 Tax=Cerrena zonata TaxID=2478898 RepID=A0AAW0G8Y8_9APHY